MATKVFELKTSIGVPDCSLSTNTIKSHITGLLSCGKECQVINITLVPKTYKDPIITFLQEKTNYKFFECEALILSKKEEFLDGKKFTANEYLRRVKDALPLVTNGNGEPLGIDLFSCTCTRL